MAIINDNDMEIIVKGNQEKVIRKMLTNRVFCLLKLPVKKSEKYSNSFSSSVFVGSMNDGLVRTFAIRESGMRTPYGDCEYYLSMYYLKGKDLESRQRFNRGMKRIKDQSFHAQILTIKKMISFLNDKELVIITNYVCYGNMEAIKVDDCLNELLLLRDEKEFGFIMRDENCDVRVYLSRISDCAPFDGRRLCPKDVRDFDVGQRIVDLLHAKSRTIYKEKYYCVELEARSEDTKALYFITRFHSNNIWKADPVVIVTARISVFVLPGNGSCSDVGDISPMKIARNNATGMEYSIDSIHFNSDICYDISEFEDLIGTHFLHFIYE